MISWAANLQRDGSQVVIFRHRAGGPTSSPEPSFILRASHTSHRLCFPTRWCSAVASPTQWPFSRTSSAGTTGGYFQCPQFTRKETEAWGEEVAIQKSQSYPGTLRTGTKYRLNSAASHSASRPLPAACVHSDISFQTRTHPQSPGKGWGSQRSKHNHGTSQTEDTRRRVPTTDGKTEGPRS